MYHETTYDQSKISWYISHSEKPWLLMAGHGTWLNRNIGSFRLWEFNTVSASFTTQKTIT